MTINTWNAPGVSGNPVPESLVLSNLSPNGGNVVFSHVFGSTAPVVGSWLGLLPRLFSGFAVTRLEIDVPYCDTGTTIKWQLGIFNYDTGVMNTGGSYFAGELFTVTAGNAANLAFVAGVSTASFSAGEFGGGSFIRASASSLLELTPPTDRFSNSSFGIGLVCSTAPTVWNPTDAAPKKLIVAMSLAPRAVRS